jgi:hypothetical protein
MALLPKTLGSIGRHPLGTIRRAIVDRETIGRPEIDDQFA